jgi:hypothetical protein
VSPGESFRILCGAIHWLGRDIGMDAAARAILAASQAPRTHTVPIAAVCDQMVGPVPLTLDPLAWRLAEQVMAAHIH